MGKILKNPFQSSAWVTLFLPGVVFRFHKVQNTKAQQSTWFLTMSAVVCVFSQDRSEQPADASEKLLVEEPKGKKQVKDDSSLS